MTPTLAQARAMKDVAKDLFSRFASVNGIGVTRIDGGYGIKVNLKHRPAPNIVMPTSVEGIPVRVEVVGSLRKL